MLAKVFTGPSDEISQRKIWQMSLKLTYSDNRYIDIVSPKISSSSSLESPCRQDAKSIQFIAAFYKDQAKVT